ncbi:uncharacterized protein BDR25DRAFT_366539 [Lindgomyces ingoldianus]|uniref:Uncharacterized protein n=1 Tax=Lindgomyces ingoldianus TaxID=673940 RepID=A0ACB6R2J1_9PLEO|nr:uncharacterized protein BDR25DRAFT_366539 [Lindgomyces ingoldianus]KAF2472552.1 hypothetical protein BDR25DRAFT_366539 [Lindgomyces ingoldianus]
MTLLESANMNTFLTTVSLSALFSAGFVDSVLNPADPTITAVAILPRDVSDPYFIGYYLNSTDGKCALTSLRWVGCVPNAAGTTSYFLTKPVDPVTSSFSGPSLPSTKPTPNPTPSSGPISSPSPGPSPGPASSSPNKAIYAGIVIGAGAILAIIGFIIYTIMTKHRKKEESVKKPTSFEDAPLEQPMSGPVEIMGTPIDPPFAGPVEIGGTPVIPRTRRRLLGRTITKYPSTLR